jgi:hypothetical protein
MRMMRFCEGNNVLQISEGTNSVGIVRGIWAFAYVLLCVCKIFNNYFFAWGAQDKKATIWKKIYLVMM